MRIGCSILFAALTFAALVPVARATPLSGTKRGHPWPPTSNEVDGAIVRTLAQPEYAWRLPAKSDQAASPGLLSHFFRQIGKTILAAAEALNRLIAKIEEWLRRFNPSPTPGTRVEDANNWQSSVRLLLFAAASLVAALLGVTFYRIWQSRRPLASHAEAAPAADRSEIEEEHADPARLPLDGWLSIAAKFRKQGDYRLAIRSLFLASLSLLAHHGGITIARHKSNRDYCRELQRRMRDIPACVAAFASQVAIVEKVWYGNRPATEELLDEFMSYFSEAMACANHGTKREQAL